MARIKVTTDDGREVWASEVLDAHAASRVPSQPSHATMNAALSGMQRALRDANIIQAGGDPERPSEKAMRLAEEARAEPAVCQCWNEGQFGRVHREDCPIHREGGDDA